MGLPSSEDVLKFWFEEAKPMDWYKKNPEFDQKIRDRFLELHTAIMNEKCDDWMGDPRSATAGIIVLDQFSRNMFRDDPKSFAYDEKALQMSKEAIKKGYPSKVG